MILTILKNIIFWFFALIFLTIPFTLLFIWKVLIIIITKIIYPSWEAMKVRDVMTIADNIYIKPLLNIGLILEVNGILNMIQFREHFTKVLLEPKNLRTHRPTNGNFFANIATIGGVCFKRRIDPASVNLETQIYEANMQENQTISEFIVNFFYAPYDESKPLWAVAVLHLPEANKTKIFFKLHHSMGDGYSLIYIFDKLTNNSTPNVVPGFGESFWDKVKLIAGAPVTMQEFGKKTAEIKNPISMSGIDPMMFYKCFTLDLDSVKKIRKKVGVHIAPILLTLQGGVIRKLLLEKHEYSELDLPVHVYSGHSLPWPSHPRNKMCNEWTVGVFKVPIKNPNPLERLKETDRDYVEFLASGFSRLVKRLLGPIMSLIPLQLVRKMGDAEMSMSTSWSSILAGNDYELLGKPVQHIFPFVGFTSNRMAIVTMSLSHSEKIDVTMGSNLEFVENEAKLDHIAEVMIQEELKSLLALCNIIDDIN